MTAVLYSERVLICWLQIIHRIKKWMIFVRKKIPSWNWQHIIKDWWRDWRHFIRKKFVCAKICRKNLHQSFDVIGLTWERKKDTKWVDLRHFLWRFWLNFISCWATDSNHLRNSWEMKYFIEINLVKEWTLFWIYFYNSSLKFTSPDFKGTNKIN